MLIGEFLHTIDAKKRISLPAKFRKEIGKGAVITKGLDKCLFVYPVSEWKNFAEWLSALPMGQKDKRDLTRIFLASASEVESDKLGRILIPDYLKKYAELEEKAVICGMYKRLEIWNEKRWEKYREETEKQADILAEKMGEMGIA
ncbi:MAG: division/cell wall cluster transcriptional repressor MraZ [Candidatus Niyogibacteria bacterium]|nr:division/cell wall cluster transcriptional repressor MraZ [Candidatus Niyogibacteria bacterium]